MRPSSVTPENSHYEDRTRSVAWRRGSLPPAGLYLVDGRLHMAARESVAEQRLLAGGALLVANARFDGAQVPALTGGTLARGTHPAEVVPMPAVLVAAGTRPEPSEN
ncbi:MAG TPA: hypothetical protein VNP72_02925 [Longimicrobium sp.]|nr:hypothetical protein [Longimicrobium sp.]